MAKITQLGRVYLQSHLDLKQNQASNETKEIISDKHVSLLIITVDRLKNITATKGRKRL